MPLGECVTRVEGGRMIYGGGGSSSKSSTSQTTSNADNRVAVQGGANVAAGASVNGMTINDPATQVHAMDVVGSSTNAAMAALIASGDKEINLANLMLSAQAINNKSAFSTVDDVSTRALDSMRAVSQDAISGMSGTSADAMNTILASEKDLTLRLTQGMDTVLASGNDMVARMTQGMNTVLSSSRDMLTAQSLANQNIASQIDSAYQTASDVSTGNKQLVNAALAVVAIAAVSAFFGRRAAS